MRSVSDSTRQSATKNEDRMSWVSAIPWVVTFLSDSPIPRIYIIEIEKRTKKTKFRRAFCSAGGYVYQHSIRSGDSVLLFRFRRAQRGIIMKRRIFLQTTLTALTRISHQADRENEDISILFTQLHKK